MAIVRERLANRDALAAWLQENAVPTLFKSVTYENSVIACFDDEDNKVLEIDSVGGIYAYRAEGNSISFVPDTGGLGMYAIDLIACNNGIILESGYYTSSQATNTGKVALMITKTNNGVPAIIFSYLYNNKVMPYYTAIKHVAFGDSETLATETTFSPESGQQTMLVPFATNVKVGDVSYTPDAFYMPMNSAYQSGIGKFSIGDDVFITNGYWAIKDS